jgi:hypothetical protein
MRFIKKFTILTMLFCSARLNAQITEGFENAALDTVMLLNGSDGLRMHYFNNGEMTFPVSYDTAFKYWASGWALSKIINNKVEPPNFAEHLYSAAPGYGVENGNKGKALMVGQNGSFFYLQRRSANDFPLKGFYVSNSTYAYNSMKFGDMFAKKFGGTSGKDQDSFILIIRSYKQSMVVDSQRVILADYRFADSAKDYILNEWKFVNLKDTYTDSIAFELQSSDVGQWGMNTPAFFVLDGVEFFGLNSVEELNVSVNIYPVPASDLLHIAANTEMESISMLDFTGQIKGVYRTDKFKGEISTQNLANGYYIIKIKTRAGIISKTIQIVR